MDDMTARVSTKGQLTVPKAARDALGISGGSQLVFRIDNGRAMIARTKRLLDTAAAPADEITATSRLPWDANRRSMLRVRSKPRRTAPKDLPTWQDPADEITVDLRSVPEPEASIPEGNADAT